MTTLTPERLAELRKVAEAATQGEWKRGLWPDTFTINGPGYDICRIIDDDDARPLIAEEKSLCAEEDADHIVAFDPPTCLALLAALGEAQAGEAYERNRADTLVEENAYFVEEAEMFGKLIYRAIETLGKKWREETDDDGEQILLGAIAELLADRDRLAAQVSEMQSK